ncbi:radical SAM/SPASM domain-containing protein [Alkaliphilus crotonatoxidans]
MTLKSRNGLIQVYSDNNYYAKDIMDLNDNAIEQFRKAKEKQLFPKYLASPMMLIWEITAKCPQNCIYCYNNSPRQVDELSSRQLFDVADQLIESKLFNICVTGGEPTMRPEYFDLIRYLRLAGINVGTVVSGANLNKQKAQKIAASVNTVQVSLDGSTAEIHDSIRRRKGSYDEAINAIKLFVDLGMYVHVAFAANRHNADDFERVYELCYELGAAALRTQKLGISGRAKEDTDQVRPTDEQYNRILDLIKHNDNKKLKIEYGDPTVHIKSGRELDITTMARITAEGNLGLSPYLEIYFGNLKTESYQDIWKRMRNGWVHPTVVDILNRDVVIKDGEILDNTEGKIFIKEVI